MTLTNVVIDCFALKKKNCNTKIPSSPLNQTTCTMHMHGIARHFSVKHDMNQRKFFINQQRVKHCLWQKSQKFDHYFFFRLCRYLHHPIFFMDGMTNFERGLVINSSSKQKKCFNFTNFFLCTVRGLRYIFSSNQIVLKILFSFCFWAPDLFFYRF